MMDQMLALKRRLVPGSHCASFSVTQDRQIQLIQDLLTSEGSSNSIQLSAEQRSALAFLNTNGQTAANVNTSRR